MKLSKEVTSLVLRVQELVMQNENMTMYCQSNISLISIYSFGENRKYSYHRELYLDGLIFNEIKVIKELKSIIIELEMINNENNRKTLCV